MNRIFVLLSACMASTAMTAQTTLKLSLSSKVDHQNAPVVVSLAPYGTVRSATVTVDGKEVPCQLDDLNKDGVTDELSFVTDISKKKAKTAAITLYSEGKAKIFPAKTFAEIVLRNPNAKAKNKQDIYLSAITVDKETANPYNVLHHHGVAFENELIAMRIYMDQRQTIDLYGKFHKGLELHDTQFYTSKEQKAQGYGDDVLWVGNTFGLGALRGWNGSEPTMIADVAHRTHRILAQGAVRTIVEVEDAGWVMNPGEEPVNMTIRYTLYAGRRDFDVDVSFNRDMTGKEFSTGVINVKGSQEYTDRKGTRGCWGTDWPATDTLNWKRETVGLGVYIPATYRVREVPANKDNYAMVMRPAANTLHYSLTYTSANEDFGYHSANEWFAYLKAWREKKENEVVVRKL